MQDAFLDVDGTNQLPHGRQLLRETKRAYDAGDPGGKDREGAPMWLARLPPNRLPTGDIPIKNMA